MTIIFIFFELWLTRFQMIACLAELALASVLRALSTRVMFITSSTLTPASTAAPALTPARWAPSTRLSNQASQDFRRGRPKVLVVLFFFVLRVNIIVRISGQCLCTHFQSMFMHAFSVNVIVRTSGQYYCMYFHSIFFCAFPLNDSYSLPVSILQNTFSHTTYLCP